MSKGFLWGVVIGVAGTYVWHMVSPLPRPQG